MMMLPAFCQPDEFAPPARREFRYEPVQARINARQRDQRPGVGNSDKFRLALAPLADRALVCFDDGSSKRILLVAVETAPESFHFSVFFLDCFRFRFLSVKKCFISAWTALICLFRSWFHSGFAYASRRRDSRAQ